MLTDFPPDNPVFKIECSQRRRPQVRSLVKKLRKEGIVLSLVWLCNPMDCSLPGSSTRGIFQARILERAAISYSRGSSQHRDWTIVSLVSPALAGRFFTTGSPGNRELKSHIRKKRKNELLILFFESHVLVLLFKIFKLLWNSIAKLRPEVCGNQFWITPPPWVCSPVSVVLDIQRQAPELLSVQLEPQADLTHPHFYLLRSFILGTVTSVFQEVPWLGLPPKEWDQRTWNSTWFIVGAW